MKIYTPFLLLLLLPVIINAQRKDSTAKALPNVTVVGAAENTKAGSVVTVSGTLSYVDGIPHREEKLTMKIE